MSEQPATNGTTKNYGFVIDNRKCIGCHACSTACKSENEVPLGVYRTWVKSVETGHYPHTRRHFQVTRCNHCANPPCVRICPTAAMVQRADGIVEFDGAVCIGCKACMQACPYDAIYIDPETDTAAKCHYCAHRTDIGLEPACVVVCPEHAIIAGDMNDPRSEISALLAREKVTVRKPEQGTAPKLFYIEGSQATLQPTATERTPETFMSADVIPLHAANGKDRAAGQSQSWAGPIHFGHGRMAQHLTQVSYNAQHELPWRWPVPAYLVTKAIGAGLFIFLALGWGLGLAPFDSLIAVIAGVTILLFVALTTFFLVYDLEKPQRFFFILLRPQWRSWLARGAVILIAFALVAGLWWLLETLAYFGAAAELTNHLRAPLLWLGLPLAALVAIYTAFLFAQAEGRDLWQSPLLPFHLLIQSLLAGSGLVLVLHLFVAPAPLASLAAVVFAAALLVDLFLTLAGEFGMSHASEDATRAAHDISHGSYRRHFWIGSIALGHLLPLALIAGWPSAPILGALAALAAVAGLYFYEVAFVMAPQEIPNS